LKVKVWVRRDVDKKAVISEVDWGGVAGPFANQVYDLNFVEEGTDKKGY
jgi:hypothetical protein